ncbi:MAG: nucleotidyltransferase domain-containing protein [Patescibacteria group bacterium]
MLGTKQSEFELLLISSRETILEKIQKLFQNKAVEGHIFGSLARGNSDAYSDIDIWFTFPDEDIEKVLAHRFEYYAEIGEVLHICEPPQNAPLQGVQTSVTYKTVGGYLTVDCSLCPLSTSHSYPEAHRLFGIELPVRTMEFNPQKVQVNESYRIDFLILFIFSAIKKLARNQSKPLKALFEQYQYFPDRYGIVIEPLLNNGQDFVSLKKIIEKINKVANEKQQKTLSMIGGFIDKIETNPISSL